MDRQGLDPEHFLALEDAKGGVLSARKAGVSQVVALTTTHTAKQLEALPSEERPTAITPTHADFQRIFLES